MNAAIASYPIAPFLSSIVADPAQVVLVTADTGSGKSVGVPAALLEAGISAVVTEPLRETVTGTAEFLRLLLGARAGLVGFATSESREQSGATRVLYCTTGLALVRSLFGSHGQWDTLVLDEAHVWALDQEVLFAWALARLVAGDAPFKRLILLSATVAAEEIARHVRGLGISFSRHDVPGRCHPIEDRTATSVAAGIRAAVAEGCDVLAFLPGQREIEELAVQLKDLPCPVLPFYGRLDRAEKDRAYRPVPRGRVILATNALETGRTVLPAEGRRLAVVDSCVERRTEVHSSGVAESLVLAPISRAQSLQRRGRTGRVGPGVYIRCGESRGEFPTPEIQRTLLGQAILRVAVAGFDLTALPLLHAPAAGVLAAARQNLTALGFITEGGALTPSGREAAYLPLAPWAGRMMQEAVRRGCARAAAAVAACIEVGGIAQRNVPLGETFRSDVARDLALWAAGERDFRVNRGALVRARAMAGQILDALPRVGQDTAGVEAVEAAYIIAHQDSVLRPHSGDGATHRAPSGTALRPWSSCGARTGGYLVGQWRGSVDSRGVKYAGIEHAVPVTLGQLRALGLPVVDTCSPAIWVGEGGATVTVTPTLHGVTVGADEVRPAPATSETAARLAEALLTGAYSFPEHVRQATRTWSNLRRSSPLVRELAGVCHDALQSAALAVLSARVAAGNVGVDISVEEFAPVSAVVEQIAATAEVAPADGEAVSATLLGHTRWLAFVEGAVRVFWSESEADDALAAEAERLARRSQAEREYDARYELFQQLVTFGEQNDCRGGDYGGSWSGSLEGFGRVERFDRDMTATELGDILSRWTTYAAEARQQGQRLSLGVERHAARIADLCRCPGCGAAMALPAEFAEEMERYGRAWAAPVLCEACPQDGNGISARALRLPTLHDAAEADVLRAGRNRALPVAWLWVVDGGPQESPLLGLGIYKHYGNNHLAFWARRPTVAEVDAGLVDAAPRGAGLLKPKPQRAPTAARTAAPEPGPKAEPAAKVSLAHFASVMNARR